MIYLIIFYHWLGDFIFQTDDMARNKSKSNKWLGKHVLVYSLWISPPALIADWQTPGYNAALFVGINGLAHFAIDYVSSRITSKLWAKGDVHNFFVVVGLDQALHMVTLVASFKFIFKAHL